MTQPLSERLLTAPICRISAGVLAVMMVLCLVACADRGTDACEPVLGKHLDALVGDAVDASLITLEHQIDEAISDLEMAEHLHGANHVEAARRMNNLGSLLEQAGRYAEAGVLYQGALEIYQKEFGEHLYVAITLNNMAGLQQAMGHYSQAENLYRRALKMKYALSDSETANLATTLNNLGVLLERLGRYPESEKHLRHALAIDEKLLPPNHPDLGKDLANLANLLSVTGRHQEAEKLFLKALAIYEQNAGSNLAHIATTLNNLAALQWQVQGFEAAENNLLCVIDIEERLNGRTHRNVAVALNNAALLKMRAGDYDHATALVKRALSIYRELLGEEHPLYVNSLRNRGLIQFYQGEQAQAEEDLLTAYRTTLLSGEPELLWKLLDNLRLVHAAEQPNLAIYFGKQSVNTLQGLRANLTLSGASVQRMFTQSISEVYTALSDLLITQGRLAEAQQVLNMLKEEEYFDFLRRDAGADPRDTEASYVGEEASWADRYAEISSELVSLGKEYRLLSRIPELERSEAQNARYTQLQSDMSVAKAAFSAYLEKLRGAFHQMDVKRIEEFGEKRLRSLGSVQGKLRRAGEAVVLIHYLIASDRLHILLTTADSQLARSVSVSQDELNEMVGAYRGLLTEPLLEPRPLAQKLYELMIGPIESDLEQVQAKTLLVSLDGVLRYLPLAALYDGEQWLVEKYALAMYTSASADNLGQTGLDHWRVAGLGVSEGAAGFTDLPTVPFELNDIVLENSNTDESGVLPGMIRLNSEFKPQALTNSLEQGFPVVHIASHFQFTPGTEVDSFLVTGNGGRLTLAEFRTGPYPLHDVDLLTLSACQTAIGDSINVNGREVEGLGVMAQYRGARTVMATLWPIADASTGVFMRNFYHDIHQHKYSKARALQSVQLGFIRGEISFEDIPQQLRGGVGQRSAESKIYMQDSERPLAHPYFWAPFILMGNP